MRTLVRGTTVLVLLSVVASCSGLLKKGGDDAGQEASVVDVPEAGAPVPAPAALASNEGDVARFPDEVAIANEAAVLQRTYNVREAPPAGAVVAGLTKGTAVTKIASRDRYFLLTFDKAGTKMMGWVHKDAFSAVIQDAGPLVCPTGEIALFGDVPFCGKLCSADKDCPTNQACKGQANKLLPNGKAGDGVTVCTAFHPHDAGAPPPPPPAVVDAGPAKIDAGPAKVDAGPAPGPSPAQDVVPATGGTCPGNFVLVKKTGKCHRPCPSVPAGVDCKNANKFCIKCDADNKKVCAESRDQCK